MARAALRRLTLTDFRSYAQATLELDGRTVLLFGPNGAGKTNLLEAVSYLSPGRGLRGASLAEVGRRGAHESQGRPWAVAAVVAIGEGSNVQETRVGSGVEAGSTRRRVRLDGETVQPARLADVLRLAWLTPSQDRLFIEGASERRRFIDRLAFAAEPGHAVHAAAYDRTMRERMRLLTEGAAATAGPDPQWLDALESRLTLAGTALAAGRRRTLSALQAEIDTRADRPFPQAELDLSGEWGRIREDDVGADGERAGEADRLAEALRRGRPRDAAAGRALVGPHRTDLIAIHREKRRAAAECSTGEQKALILNLVLAQAARLVRAESAPDPILLLDEVAAHLDASRRIALFDEIAALGLQTFLTGTDRSLFEALGARAQAIHVRGSTFEAD